MFGKIDDGLVDSSYQTTASAQPAADTSFGSAGGDFMSAPAAPLPAFEQQAAAPMPSFTEAPAATEPSFAEPAMTAAPAPAPLPEPAFEPEASFAPTEPQIPDELSFSQRFGQAEPAPAPMPEPAPEAFASQEPAAVPSFSDYTAEPSIAPEAPMEAFAEPAPEAAPAPDLMAAEPAPAYEEPAAFAPEEPQAESYSTSPKEDALQQAAAALGSEVMAHANGGARIQAIALKILVEKAQREDGTAIAQLNSHGFQMLTDLAAGLPVGSPALDKVVESAEALFSSELVTPTTPQRQQQRSFTDRVSEKPDVGQSVSF